MHVQIQALCHVYKFPVRVYQADTPVVTVGEDYHHTPLTLSYVLTLLYVHWLHQPSYVGPLSCVLVYYMYWYMSTYTVAVHSICVGVSYEYAHTYTHTHTHNTHTDTPPPPHTHTHTHVDKSTSVRTSVHTQTVQTSLSHTHRYHRHEYGLGEHYNSIIPNTASSWCVHAFYIYVNTNLCSLIWLFSPVTFVFYNETIPMINENGYS